MANWLFAQTTHIVESNWCMVGGLRCVVILVKCDPNRLRGHGAVGVENGPSLLLWPVAYTTACSTVQAVIIHGVAWVCQHQLSFLFYIVRCKRNAFFPAMSKCFYAMNEKPFIYLFKPGICGLTVSSSRKYCVWFSSSKPDSRSSQLYDLKHKPNAANYDYAPFCFVDCSCFSQKIPKP